MNTTGSKECQCVCRQIILASRPQVIKQFFSDITWKINKILRIPQPAYVLSGTLKHGNADVSLGLQPGEKVQIKSLQEIQKVLDKSGRLGGLSFMPEMKTCCGHVYIVFKRVNNILLESSGKLRAVNNIVILKDLTCNGELHYHCDRSCFFFWKENWLKRIDFVDN